MIQNDVLLLSMISYIFIHKPCINEDIVIGTIMKLSFFFYKILELNGPKKNKPPLLI